jgi:hypothetical protein
MQAEVGHLPHYPNWTTNCVPYESFLGRHPAFTRGSTWVLQPAQQPAEPLAPIQHGQRRRLGAAWLGAACFLGFLTPPLLRELPRHYAPLTFIASEGPLPDVWPLNLPFATVTMLRRPADRVLSSYRWWQVCCERHSTCKMHANISLLWWCTSHTDYLAPPCVEWRCT